MNIYAADGSNDNNSGDTVPGGGNSSGTEGTPAGDPHKDDDGYPGGVD